MNAMFQAMASLGAVAPPPPPGDGPTYIDAKGANFYGSSVENIPVPAACVAGDSVLLMADTVGNASASSIAPPSGAQSVFDGGRYFAAYTTGFAWLYVLTSTDIANGYITVDASASSNATAITALYASGVTGVDTYSTAFTQSSSATANGITTSVDGALIVYHCGVDNYSHNTVITDPSGFTPAIQVGDNSDVSSREKSTTVYKTQATAGPTGDISASFTGGGRANSFLFALK